MVSVTRTVAGGDRGRHRVRELSRALVLSELQRGPGATQPELVRKTGLARATVAAVIAELNDEGRIIRQGRASTGRGRPAELLSVRKLRGHIAAVDVGHTHLTVALATADGDVIAESKTEFDADASGIASVDAAASAVRCLMTESGVSELLVVGLGVPGPLEHFDDGSIRSGGVMAGWADLQPARRFQERFGSSMTVTVDNDAHLGMIGEHAYGAARGYRTALYVKVGAGIGAGIMIDDLPYRGGHGTSGEIGHVRILEQGEVCRCGGRGCLETIASTTFALKSLQAVHGSTLTMAGVSDLLHQGDPGAIRLFEDIGEAIGRVVAGAASAIDPEIIIIGSPVTDMSPLTTGVEHAVGRYTQPFIARHTRVVPGQLGDRASLMGVIARATRIAPVQVAK
jgi:predicted NBD/HSP70 family sugar kinase